jgi:hypothetical protein
MPPIFAVGEPRPAWATWFELTTPRASEITVTACRPPCRRGRPQQAFFWPRRFERIAQNPFSKVFFPSSRRSSRKWYCNARCSEAGAPSTYSQVNTEFGAIPCGRATNSTDQPPLVEAACAAQFELRCRHLAFSGSAY